jgi:hypothetical protein
MASVDAHIPTPLGPGGLVPYRPVALLASYSMLANATATDPMTTQSVFYKIEGTTVPGTDLKGFTAAVTNRLVATTATGRFRVTGNATIAVMTADSSFTIGVFNSRTGAVTVCGTAIGAGSTGALATQINIDALVDLRATDYIEIHLRNNTAGGQVCTVTNLFVRVESV